MATRTTNILLFILVIAAWATVFFTYPSLPVRMAAHWNAEGVVDGYMSRFWGATLMPFVMTSLLVLYAIIPLIDPLKTNIESFRRTYNVFWVGVEIFLGYVFGLTLAWNLGYHVDLTQALVPGLAAGLYGLGMLMERTRRNWFMGIRTPWTLSSDMVWTQTHRLGALLFKISSVITLVLFLVWGSRTALSGFIISVVCTALVSVVYSFMLFRQGAK